METKDVIDNVEVEVAGDGKPTVLQRIRDKRLARDTRGLSTVEYVILLVLVAVIAVAGWQKLGKRVKKGVDDANNNLNNAGLKLP